MTTQKGGSIRRGQPITDALYGRKGQRRPKPAAKPRRPQQGTTLGDTLDQVTLWKLEQLAKGGRRRRGAK